MPSITSWTRLEPHARSETVDTGLEARIHDPLWLLARQWQFGEFQGEDNGTPIRAELITEQSQLEKYLPGKYNSPKSVSSRPYNKNLPLEVLVEREPVHQPGNYHLAAEAGLQFLRIVGPALLEHERAEFLKAYPLPANDPNTNENGTKGLLSVMARRVINGILIRSEFPQTRQIGDQHVLPNKQVFNVPTDRIEDLVKALTEWLDWYDTLFSQPQEDNAWMSERMEYEFAVAAPAPPASGIKGNLVLVAPEYYEGHLDWYSFKVDTTHKMGISGKPRKSAPISAIPTPIRFRGMPATRFWEFEDAGVNFGGVDTAPEDLSRLLLTEFALIYGNDFFVVPIELEVGTICSISSLIVTNNFGEADSIQSSGKTDNNHTPWRMFCISPLAERGESKGKPFDFLFLPPVLGATFEGVAIEEVLLLRDEMANMAWAVERIVESPAGQPLNRFEDYHEERRRQEAANPDMTIPRSGPLEYKLATSVPPYWIPLLPVHKDSGQRDIWLQLGDFNEPTGNLLPPLASTTTNQKLHLHEEEVPREGAIVTRSYQYTRWIDGSTHLWVGRRKRIGKGEGSSGLRFDVVVPGK